MGVTFRRTNLDGVLICDLEVYEDPRGFFVETFFTPEKYAAGGIVGPFCWDEAFSRSIKGAPCGACISGRDVPRASSSPCSMAPSGTWPWTSAADRRLAGGGWALRCRMKIGGSCSFRRVCPRVLCAQRTHGRDVQVHGSIYRPRMTGACCGTIPNWPSTGPP